MPNFWHGDKPIHKIRSAAKYNFEWSSPCTVVTPVISDKKYNGPLIEGELIAGMPKHQGAQTTEFAKDLGA
jgi:hypothetical protein